MGFTLRNVLILATLLFAQFSSAADLRGASGPMPPRIDLVFDLDWTLISTLDKNSVIRDRSKVIVVDDVRYRIADDVAESLIILRRHPQIHLSVFSGGKHSRNVSILKKIILDERSGLTAFDVMDRVLSFEDLVDLYPNDASEPKLKFLDRYRKNLSRHFPDLSRTILIDDVASFAVSGEERNLLSIGPTRDFYETYADVPKSSRGKKKNPYTPESEMDWAMERKRIPVHTLILESAVLEEEAANAEPVRSFVERVREKRKTPKVVFFDEWKERLNELPCTHSVRPANSR